MSESNGASAPYGLPDELFTVIMVDGTAYTVDIIEAHVRQNQLADELKQYPENEWWYLTALGEWLTAQKWPTMRLAQLDRLWVELRVAFADRKKKQRMQLEAMQTSPSSSVSTPEETG